MIPLPAPQVPIVPIGALVPTSLVWRWRGRFHVTVTAQATFALQARTLMSPVLPEPLHNEDVVPFRRETDVVVSAAHAYSEQPTEAMAVRLLLRGRESFIDKSLLVYAPRPGGVVEPFQTAPIVQHGKPTKALVIDPTRPTERGSYGRLAGRDPTLADGGEGVLEVDDDVDWNDFQTAPDNQRVVGLRGDEWLLLEGMTPDRRRFESRLPGAVVETRIYPPDLWCGKSVVLAMEMASLVIDADHHKCSIVWRGAFTVQDLATARALTIVSALHTPGLMTSWPTVGQLAMSTELHLQRSRLAGLADTARPAATAPRPAAGAPPSREEELQRRVAARIKALGPLATMPVDDGTQPIEEPPQPSPPTPTPSKLAVRDGVISLDPEDPSEVRVTDSGTLDLPPDKNELAPPASTFLGLAAVPGAPWNDRDLSAALDAAQRAAGGTVVSDSPPPDVDGQDVDKLEQTLSDSADEGRDPVAELFEAEIHREK